MKYALVMAVDESTAHPLYADRHQIGADTVSIEVIGIYDGIDLAEKNLQWAKDHVDTAKHDHGDMATPYGNIRFWLAPIRGNVERSIANYLFDEKFHRTVVETR